MKFTPNLSIVMNNLAFYEHFQKTIFFRFWIDPRGPWAHFGGPWAHNLIKDSPPGPRGGIPHHAPFCRPSDAEADRPYRHN